jgi:hypothetical protein
MTHPSDEGHRMFNRSYLHEVAEVIVGVPVMLCAIAFDMICTLFGRTGR